MEQQKDAVEHHLDHVCRVGELLHLLDVSRLDGTDGFVSLLVAARFDGWMDGWMDAWTGACQIERDHEEKGTESPTPRG